ncbi:MAG: nitroreductase family protein [Chloroflexota bacterium]
MDFFEAVNQRRSIRAFTHQPVGEDKLQRILEAINRAPSAGNLQAYEVYLVRDAGLRTALAAAAGNQQFMAQAPIALMFCAHAERAQTRYGTRGTELYSVQDATIACTYAMLAATALGLATVWVGAFDEQAVAKIVGLSPGHRPVAMLPIGYAAESPHAPKRRPLADIVHEVK